jgi:hypothetical protein
VIGAALLLAATVATAQPIVQPIAEPEEIVVLARKLQSVQLRMSLSKKQGIYRAKSCAIRKSTGDAEIDPIPCEAARQCSTLGLTTQASFVACVKSRGREQIAVLADRRSMAGDAE